MSSVLLHPASAAAAAVAIRAMLALWWGSLARPRHIFETDELVRNWFAGRGYTFHFLGTDYRSFHSALPYDLLYSKRGIVLVRIRS